MSFDIRDRIIIDRSRVSSGTRKAKTSFRDLIQNCTICRSFRVEEEEKKIQYNEQHAVLSIAVHGYTKPIPL